MEKKKSKFRPVLMDRDKQPDLTKNKIGDVFKALDHVIERAGAKYAVIGGALFEMLGIDGYSTKDIDVASDMYLDGFGIQTSAKARPRSTSKMIGHYLVNDVCIDWMTEGKPGSKELFQATVKSAYLKDGIWLANLEFATAIKLYAGREDDVEVFRWFVDEGIVNEKLVREILDQYVPFWEVKF